MNALLNTIIKSSTSLTRRSNQRRTLSNLIQQSNLKGMLIQMSGCRRVRHDDNATFELSLRMGQNTSMTCKSSYYIDTFNNDIFRGKALKSLSFVLREFSQIANIEPTLTTYWYKRGEQLRNE